MHRAVVDVIRLQ